MFDGLKDKLGRFRDDVEEEAEEVETADSEATEEAEAEAEAEVEAVEATAEAEAAETASEAETGAETADADAGAATEADSEAETEAATETEGSDPGLGERTKAFVSGKRYIDAEDLEGPLDDLEIALLSSDVEMSVAEAILDNVREELVGTTRGHFESTGDLVTEALHDALVDVIAVGQFDFEERVAEADKPLVVVFTGVNGVGKTTTIAKLARYLEERGYSSVLANGDTYRAGANEQIREHAENLGVELISHEQGSDPAAVLYDAVEYAEANDVDVVLGDTAGRLHTSSDLMEQLAKIDRVVEPDMTLFVDEAVAGQDAVNRAEKFDEAAAIDGAVLTKADADANGGAAISIAYVTGKPILFLGVGQGYDDLERFDPEALVRDLLDEG
ncbi:MAG: signal recognition particle-docking protein FtsY [Halobacteriaceae archaeon]